MRVWIVSVPFVRPFLTLTLLLLVSACGKETPAPQTKQDTARFVSDGKGDGSVWVVDAKEGAGRLFLCGTIHILRETDYPLAPAYEAAYLHSDKLVLELPPGEGSGPELSRRMAQIGMYSADTSLEANISPETWQKVRTWGASRDLDPSSLNRYRPWFVSLIMTATEYSRLGARPDLGVDTHFDQRAKADGKPGEGLETGEFQIQLFASLSDKQQRELLDQTLAEVSTVAEEYEKMIAAWKNGDLKALHDMLFREAEKHPELMNMFLTARNALWVEKLDDMLKKGQKAMVLVGSGHLTGNTGLVEMLQKRGHHVRHYREVRDL
ncbi:MAG: TraB/GumN family protein [Verrucomicrobiaceae bacterium]|nr:TraB/GumN family protein [Verrucomicrobiaceae bacterium]